MAGVAKYARKASKQHTLSYTERMTKLELEDGLRFIAQMREDDEALGLTDTPTATRAHVSRDYPGKWAASRPRVRCHGAAAMPPTPEAAQDLANGLIPATVWWTPKRGATPRVEDVATFTSRRKDKHVREVREVAVPETTAAHVQPAVKHDYTA